MAAFAALLATCCTTYGGTKAAFARRLRITPPALSRLLGNKAQPSTELCLRIAAVCRQAPQDVLRAAGKHPIAQLLDDMFGPSASPDHPAVRAARRFTDPPLTPYEREHLNQWRQLQPDEERAMQLMLTRTLLGRAQGTPRPLKFARGKHRS